MIIVSILLIAAAVITFFFIYLKPGVNGRHHKH